MKKNVWSYITKVNPSQIILLSFFFSALVGALLLWLPFSASSQHVSFIDAWFTATSAVCVTGLTVVDTGTIFTHVGQIIILFLIQVGGLGIMTFSTLFAILLGRKLTIKENVLAQAVLDSQSVKGLPLLIKYIIKCTVVIECVGAGLLVIRWSHFFKDFHFSTLYQAVFHAVSAFCNAGFSLFPDNLMQFRADTWTNIVISMLIVGGGLGFVVLMELWQVILGKKHNWFFKLSLQAKMALMISGLLIFWGALCVWSFEYNHLFKTWSGKEKILASFFQSISARTAGFNTIDIGALSHASIFVLMGLMFVGASPGSTGGGIKTVTFGVLIAAFVAMCQNKERVVIFGKTIAKIVFRRAFCVLLLAFVWVAMATLLLCLSEGHRFPGFHLLFEVISAFGTVGLSTGITPQLSVFGKGILIATMLFGRVGTLTVALSVVVQKEKFVIGYPEERVMVG